MSDLIAKIRSAQIQAGEAAVCDNLRELKARLEMRADEPEKSEPTALELADSFDDLTNYYGLSDKASAMLRSQHAEIERLKSIAQQLRYMINEAYKGMSPYTFERACRYKLCKALNEISLKDIT